jgi:hypothetical protein
LAASANSRSRRAKPRTRAAKAPTEKQTVDRRGGSDQAHPVGDLRNVAVALDQVVMAKPDARHPSLGYEQPAGIDLDEFESEPREGAWLDPRHRANGKRALKLAGDDLVVPLDPAGWVLP